MQPLSAEQQEKIRELFDGAESVTGLRLCLHDRLGRTGLPPRFRVHSHPACVAAKAKDEPACVQFDVRETGRALAGAAAGRIQTCPLGHAEAVVPVFCEGLQAGVLFAGPCWTGKGAPPHAALIRPAGPGWLPDRHVMLRAVATELGRLLSGRQDPTPASRRQRILTFLHDRLAEPVTLGELAVAVGLSPSRTGHLVRELFGMTFPRLGYSVKLREAARLLASTDLTIGEVAQHVGFVDPNYFTRVFSQEYGVSPKQYRRQFPAEA